MPKKNYISLFRCSQRTLLPVWGPPIINRVQSPIPVSSPQAADYSGGRLQVEDIHGQSLPRNTGDFWVVASPRCDLHAHVQPGLNRADLARSGLSRAPPPTRHLLQPRRGSPPTSIPTGTRQRTGELGPEITSVRTYVRKCARTNRRAETSPVIAVHRADQQILPTAPTPLSPSPHPPLRLP